MISKQAPGTPKKPIPLPLMLLADIALLAVCILSFAYFHHVRPETLENDPDKLPQAVIPNIDPYGTGNASSASTTITLSGSGEMTTTLTTLSSDLLSGTDTTTASTEGTSTAIGGETTLLGSNISTSTTTTTTTTKAPEYDLSGWGSKWPTVFSLGEEVVITENSYRSHDVAINIETRQVGSSVAYIADVYIRYLDNFQSAFAKGEYGKNIIERPETTAANNNAIFAVNGDYYGIRDNGIIVRNYVLYRDTPRGDICSLFYDGTVTVDSADSFDLNAALQNGLYQTLTFGPNLVSEYQAKTEFPAGFGGIVGVNPRTGFGYYEPGHYVFITVDGRQDGYSVGMTMSEFAALFADLGCRNAFNLDGGQSAMMIFNGKVVNQPYNGGRETSDIFYIAEVQ